MLTALGFVFLLGGIYYVWQQQQHMLTQPPGVDPAAFANLEAQVRTLQPRLSQLEQRPTADLKPLEARLAALENKPAPALVAPPDASATVSAAVEPLKQQIDALGKTDQAGQAALGSKVDAAVAKLDAATGQTQDTARQLAARVDALEKKLAQSELQAKQQAAQSAAALRGQQALTALASGKPLGEIPGASPAIARFATAAPPTEADLRQSFPAAAAHAADVSKPAGQTPSLGARMLEHAESLITVREGDKVVVGNSAALTLGGARAKLDAGDLAGAVAVLDGLDPAAAQAMAEWRAQAQALLDARAALNAMTSPVAR